MDANEKDNSPRVGISEIPEISIPTSADEKPFERLLLGLARQHDLLQAHQQALAALSDDVTKAVRVARMYLTDLLEGPGPCFSGCDGRSGAPKPMASVLLETPRCVEDIHLQESIGHRKLETQSTTSARRSRSIGLRVDPIRQSCDHHEHSNAEGKVVLVDDGAVGRQRPHALMDTTIVNEPLSPKSPTQLVVKESNLQAIRPSTYTTSGAPMELSPTDVNRNAIYRLQARLGFTNLRGKVTARALFSALRALGLEKLTLAELERCLFEILRTSKRPDITSTLSVDRRNSLQRLAFRPCIRVGRRANLAMTEPDPHVPTEMPFLHFAHALLDPEMVTRLRPELVDCALTIKEVLLSGDANRLVAELTRVRVDDLASPLPRPDLTAITEPILAAVIFLNGVMIGVQASYDNDDYKLRWFWINAAFALFFLGEISVRFYSAGGARAFFFGSESLWHWFDTCIVALALMDCGLELYGSLTNSQVSGTGPLTILRLIRLSRLTRLFRIFRLSYMKELNLMMKGLLGGIKTLGFALVLLFFTFYVIAVLTTTMLNPSGVQEVDDNHLFDSVFQSMYTIYRCFTSDCITDAGAPVIKLLSDEKGWVFTLCYLPFSVFVTFGLFNLIVAIYIESTLTAARQNEERDKAQRHRESLRVAHHTKELLKKFCTAQRVSKDLVTTEGKIRDILQNSATEDVEDADMEITKEVFLVTLQDPQVQEHMDELDLPPDRASLFDILDADGSGGLEVAELITGFLQVRGEFRKSDVVAALLAVRSCQDMLKRLDQRLGMQRQVQELRARDLQDVLAELRCLMRAGLRVPRDPVTAEMASPDASTMHL